LIAVAARERARVVVLNSPNNPTGSALPPDAVERVLAATDALVVCDEAYQDFGGPTAVGLLATSPRVVVLRTFSKAFGLAGLRLGFALAHPAVAREIAKAKLPYNVNTLSLTAATMVLAHPETEARVAEIVATRDRTFARLDASQSPPIPGSELFSSAASRSARRSSGVVEDYGSVRDAPARAGRVPPDPGGHAGRHGGGGGDWGRFWA
jgi:histidinol-phosphate aminotransferase